MNTPLQYGISSRTRIAFRVSDASYGSDHSSVHVLDRACGRHVHGRNFIRLHLACHCMIVAQRWRLVGSKHSITLR